MVTDATKRQRLSPRLEASIAGSSSSSSSIIIVSRNNEFSSQTWWMVDLNNQAVIVNRQGATALVARCRRQYGWEETKCRKVLMAYKQFLELKKEFQDWDATILSPSGVVDKMWHQHILDVNNYSHDMMLLCGHVVGHNPDGALDTAAKTARTQTTRDALRQRFASYDVEMWLDPSEVRDREEEETTGQSEQLAEFVLNDNSVILAIRDGTGKVTNLKIKNSSKMSELMKCYAKIKGINYSLLRFFNSGERVSDDDTPEILELCDQDQIDVMLEQCGC